MTKRWKAIVRRVVPVLSAGVLLQANGCALDPVALTQGLLTTVVNDVINSIVFGIFNVPVVGI